MSESAEITVYRDMKALLAKMREEKPAERSEESRRWAVAITEMEKAVAYFYTYVWVIAMLGDKDTP